MTELIPSFGGLAFTLLAFIVALSVIVAVHEYGHYLIGRLSGIHAEVFSLGFGPVLAAREDRWGTRWQIAALPFGGYVRFLGDADAASGRDSGALEELDAETRRHTMHGAPLWARAATVAAGPGFNFVLSVLLFAVVIAARGVPLAPPEIASVAVTPGSASVLAAGDRVLAIDGAETPDLAAVYNATEELPLEPRMPWQIRRDGNETTVEGPYPFPPLVGAVQPDSAAMEAGLKKGDLVLSVDGQPVFAFGQLRDIVGESGGKALRLEVLRDGERMEFTLVPRRRDLPTADGGFETRWLIGLTGRLVFEPATRIPGPLEALASGASQTWQIIRFSLSGLAHMVTGAISSCNISGPIGIAEVSGAAASQGIGSFIWFIAVLSTAVGLLNLFPIPILDGGHLVFHAYESVVGRPPPERALRALMAVGAALLIGLMAFALGNDLICP